MGLIYKPVTLIGTLGTKTLNALMDTGASDCYILEQEAKLIAPPYPTSAPITLRLGKGETQINEVIFSFVEINGYRMHWMFNIVRELTEKLIIGADFFQRWKVKLNPETEEITIDPTALKIQLI